MSPEPEERAKGVRLPDWWLSLVRKLVLDRPENMTQLGEQLADEIGKPDPWDHSAVSRFLKGRVTTAPMAEAFASLLGIPKPFYEARSLEEAMALQATSRRFDPPADRLRTMDQAAELAEQELRDQTGRVGSMDEGAEGAGRRRRPGRPARER